MPDNEMIFNDMLHKRPDETQEEWRERMYIAPTDPLILERLEWFKDLKFGFMTHWGPYSQMGLEASWPICDLNWTQHYNEWQNDRLEFKKEYWNANKTFNPVRFNPDEWARQIADCGFKYMLFTTKHHDGF